MIKPTNGICAQWRLRSARAFAQVWSESSLCALCVAKDPSFLHADSDQTWRTNHFVCFVMRRLMCVPLIHAFEVTTPWGSDPQVAIATELWYKNAYHGPEIIMCIHEHVPLLILKLLEFLLLKSFNHFIFVEVFLFAPLFCNVDEFGIFWKQHVFAIWAAMWQNQESDCAPSEDSESSLCA